MTRQAWFETTAAEREVADLLPFDVPVQTAEQVRDSVPLWCHTFALNQAAGVYTPGYVRDHRYRMPFLPTDFTGLRVLDIGTFDGFYAFLAERRGADYVLGIDNESARDWARARWGVELMGGEGFRAVKGLIGSGVEYRKLDAFDLDAVDEVFHFAYLFGVLHRVTDPLGLLRIVRRRLVSGGRVLVETQGFPGGSDGPLVRVWSPGEVNENDDDLYWGFSAPGLAALARMAGLSVDGAVGEFVIDDRPRIIASFTAI